MPSACNMVLLLYRINFRIIKENRASAFYLAVSEENVIRKFSLQDIFQITPPILLHVHGGLGSGPRKFRKNDIPLFFMACALFRNHDGVMIRQASPEDFPAILNLQFLAFGEVAERLGAASIPPLEQTLEHLQEEARHSVFFKYTENGRIVGSVRGCLDGKNVCHVGKLIVDPACRNRGVGQQLMLALEERFRGQAAAYLLFTSADTPETLYLYRKLGYTELYRKEAGGMTTVFLEKKA